MYCRQGAQSSTLTHYSDRDKTKRRGNLKVASLSLGYSDSNQE